MKTVAVGAVLALAFAACSGGSYTTTTAALQGTVYEVGGQTVDRSGVEVRVAETGAVYVTDVNGAFTFNGLRPGTYTLAFDTLLAGAQTEEGEGEEPEDECDGRHDDEPEPEDDEEEGEDDEGRPVIEIPEDGGDVEVRIALDQRGDVIEFTTGSHRVRHAMAHLHRAEGSDLRVAGKIKVKSHDEHGDRLKIGVHCIEPGTAVSVCIHDREDGMWVADAVADENTEVCIVRESGNLPFGAAGVHELAGLLVEVKIGDDVILVGEIPDLPEERPHPREDDGEGEGEEDDKPGEGEGEDEDEGKDDDEPHDGSTRGKAHLEELVDGVEGDVEIRCWPDEELQSFKMVVEGLDAGDQVVFEIENPENEGAWVVLGERPASEGGRAFYATGEGDPMPFGVESVRELVGLRVRVRLGEEVLLVGRIPELVRD